MARIVGVDMPNNKRDEIALTYIFGIGHRSVEILEKAGVNKDIKVNEWNDDQFGAIRKVITDGFKLKVSCALKPNSIKRLMDIGCYRGIRHR